MRTPVDITLDLYITSNSPGEISGWVAPVVRDIKARAKLSRVTLVLVPCQYASGAERTLAKQTGVDRIVRIGEIGRIAREEAEQGTRGANVRRLALHLGGDMMFSVYMSRRLRAPLWAYSARPRWGRFVDRYFVPDERAMRRFAILNFDSSRYERVGHLALDSAVVSEDEADTRAELGIGADETVVSFLTGSRPFEYLQGVPYFTRVARRMAERCDARMIFPLAPTVDEDRLRAVLYANGIECSGESRVRAVRIGEERWASLVRGKTLEVLNCSKLAIAVPGTNNMQAAALFVPLIMVLPLDRADEIPLDGLAGNLPLWVPGVRALKKKYLLHKNRHTEYVSMPNRIAGKRIHPEIRGIFPEERVSDEALALLNDPERLQHISRAFWELTHERGASARIADRIVKWSRQGG